MKTSLKGHAAALTSVIIWGTTFISSKIVLEYLSPIELLIYRFAVGLCVLSLMDSHKLVLNRKLQKCPPCGIDDGRRRQYRGLKRKKDEWYFILAGLSGVTLYYLLENISLTRTTASNAGVIVSAAPFFTALAAWMMRKEKCISIRFLSGFVIALSGIAMISFQGSSASAMCFVLWNYAVDRLGVITSGVYIYLTPVVTVALSIPVLHETFTWYSGAGMLLTIAGLIISG